jgi:hypothetical protein
MPSTDGILDSIGEGVPQMKTTGNVRRRQAYHELTLGASIRDTATLGNERGEREEVICE